MISRMSHATIYVKDQEKAKDFYIGKLGFELRTDATMSDFRWLTVGPKEQPDLEIVLLKPGGPMFDEETVKRIFELQDRGAMGAGVFHTKDCRKTFAELKAKGVQFMSEPQERPYGVEATFKDDSGNWFSLTQQQ